MKKTIWLLLVLVLLIPTTVFAQGGTGEDFGDKELVCRIEVFYDGGIDFEIEVCTWEDPYVVPVQYYSPSTGEIICWDDCWHEVGHKLDYEVMNSISEDPAFQDAVVGFLYGEAISTSDPHPMAWRIIVFPGFFNDMYIFPEDTGGFAGYVWGGYDELYAEILQWSEGNIGAIPWSLREFYNMDAAQEMYDAIMAAGDGTIH